MTAVAPGLLLPRTVVGDPWGERSVLHEFLIANRGLLIERAQAKVKVRRAPRATDEELRNGIPLFLDQLVVTLQRIAGADDGTISRAAAAHGADLLMMGFTIGQVVHDDGDVCQAVTELAIETEAAITANEFRILNRCLDDAIAGAVTEYNRGRDEQKLEADFERLDGLAHELRNSLNAALLGFGILKAGRVGVGGSTGAVVERSLRNLGALISRSLADVRLRSGKSIPEDIPVAALMQELEVTASMDASVHSQSLTFVGSTADVLVRADRPILAAALTNLLQNAFKFTPPGGKVTLRTSADADHVRFDVEDECGGLPAGKADELFRPFLQRSGNREGLGLGLSICRRGVEADGGSVSVRDIPGHGCVFTIELPRVRSGSPQ